MGFLVPILPKHMCWSVLRYPISGGCVMSVCVPALGYGDVTEASLCHMSGLAQSIQS